MIRNLGLFEAFHFIVEGILMVITVSLFCCAFPGQFRSELWEAGGEKGWNSNPRLRIYFYANHEEPPEIPLIWSTNLTTSNVAIATASIVVYLVRTSLALLNFNRVALNFGYDVLLSGLWYYSVSAQSSADMTDMKHPSPRPWYLGRSCGEAGGKYAYACTVSKISFDFSIALMMMYMSRSFFAVLRLAYWCGEHRIGNIWPQKLHDYLWSYRGLDHHVFRAFRAEVEEQQALI